MKNMTRQITGIFVMALVLTSSLIAAEPNFTGTWKLNLAKSQLCQGSRTSASLQGKL